MKQVRYIEKSYQEVCYERKIVIDWDSTGTEKTKVKLLYES